MFTISSPDEFLLLKLNALGYISVAESLYMSSTTVMQCASEATEFGEIKQNKGHYTIQGHSQSPILVPIKSSYTTSYSRLILTYLLSCNVS